MVFFLGLLLILSWLFIISYQIVVVVSKIRVGAILLLIIIIFFSVGWAAEKATISYQDPVALADEPTSRKVLYIVEVVDNSGYIINFWATASEFDSRMPTVHKE
jgi:hypothetical protein